MSHTQVTLNVFSRIAISMVFLLSAPSAIAEAGRVVFSYGNVTAEGKTGIIRTLAKSDHVEAGETIRTSSRSLVQMRMIDKAFIALRANSAVKIEEYRLGATKEQDSGIFGLIRGGFRAVTGIIGKRLRSAYKMRSLTATIGIRGTDYTARLCNQDCNQAFGNLSAAGSIADGLYVGVNEGGINLTNQLGTLDLDERQFGYVKDATTAPVALITAPEFLYFNSRAPNPDDQASSSDGDTTVEGSVVAARIAVEPVRADLNTDDNIKKDLKLTQVDAVQEQVEDNIIIDQVVETSSGIPFSLTDGAITSSRMVVSSYGNAAAAGSISSVRSNPFSAAEITGNELQNFENSHIDSTLGVGAYSKGTVSTIDLGFDPDTGIAWGRWSAGIARFQPASGSSVDINLNNRSLHWVTSPNQAQAIALPSSGTASYQLIGNTSPTDNLGNVGILGAATLNADFTSQTVDSSVAIGINNQVWNGIGTALPISATDGGFSGPINVDVNSGSFTGTGNAAGFLTNNGDGAGLGFSLEAVTGDGPTSVSGTAVFQKQ